MPSDIGDGQMRIIAGETSQRHRASKPHPNNVQTSSAPKYTPDRLDIGGSSAAPQPLNYDAALHEIGMTRLDLQKSGQALNATPSQPERFDAQVHPNRKIDPRSIMEVQKIINADKALAANAAPPTPRMIAWLDEVHRETSRLRSEHPHNYADLIDKENYGQKKEFFSHSVSQDKRTHSMLLRPR
jgi:hypothetical protein